jgi:hypothetical protein
VDNAQHDRGVKIRMQLDQIVNTLNGMEVSMSLVWLWTWDMIRDKFNNYSQDDFSMEYAITEGTTLDKIWDTLWANPPGDFTLEYGAEAMDDAIQDWLIEQEFVAFLDDDGWLDEAQALEEANI